MRGSPISSARLALAVILFDSGFGTPIAALRQAAMPALSLATVGVMLTTGLFGAAAFYLTDFTWLESFLLGAAVASTDAAAVFFLLRAGNVQLRDRVRSTLEIESGTNDPIAIFLTITLVEVIAAGVDPQAEVLVIDLVVGFFVHMGIGAVVGVLGGLAIVRLVERLNLDHGLLPIFVLTLSLLVFAAGGAIGGSGFLAVYLAGHGCRKFHHPVGGEPQALPGRRAGHRLCEAGPADGRPVILLHGWPYDIHSFVDVAPLLAAAGYRVWSPYLRGYGSTRFLRTRPCATGSRRRSRPTSSPSWMRSASRARSSPVSTGALARRTWSPPCGQKQYVMSEQQQHRRIAGSPAGPAGELGDQRERALLGAEVWEAQRRVGVEHDAQRYIREVVALGDHLGPEQQPRRRGGELRQHARRGVLERSRVGIQAPDREPGRAEALHDQLVLDLLGPGAVARDRDRAARVAARRHPLAVTAVMAGDRVLAAMEHQRDVAVGASPSLATGPAGEEVAPEQYGTGQQKKTRR